MRWQRVLSGLGLALMTVLLVETQDAWARATSGGSRGSRTYSSPSRPALPATPSTPTRAPESAPPPAAPRPWGLGGMLGGLLLGGLIGGLLFGQAGFGVGLLDLLLLGAGVALLVSFLRRRQPGREPAYAMAGAPDATEGTAWGPSGGVAAPTVDDDLARGVGHIQTMDPAFDPAALTAQARRAFVDVQQAVMGRDVRPLRDRLTAEMFAVLQSQCDRLRSARQTNRLEHLDVRTVDLTEAWQEGGQDFVTVRIAAALLDYTVDDTTGRVIDGSRDQTQEIEEYWTFTRPVGPTPWKLSAIQSG